VSRTWRIQRTDEQGDFALAAAPDNDPGFSEIEVTAYGTSFTVGTPNASGNTKVSLIAGYYMLFILSSNGVPSKARIIRLG
jgi:hypothetical protein